MSKITCFLSYCHQDVDRVILDYLKVTLEENSNQEYEILLDAELHYGSSLTEFMALLEKVHAVIILMTPAYKARLLNRGGGVYEEYTRIILRYLELKEIQEREDKKIREIPGYFELIPVLLSGTHTTSVPEEIVDLKYLDLSHFHVRRGKTGNFVIPNPMRNKYLPEIQKIAANLQFIATMKNPSFKELHDEYFDRLFLERKADWMNPRDVHHDYPEYLFVKTHAYRKILEQSVYFLIGRKGSGKSTITSLLAVVKDKTFEGVVPIVADDFDLELAYALFSWDKVQSDTRTFVNRLKCFEFVWEAFIYICIMEILVRKSQDAKLTKYQSQYMDSVREFVHKLGTQPGRDNLSTSAVPVFFTFCWNGIVRFIDDCINSARSDEQYFYSDIQLRFDRKRFFVFLFGTQILEDLERIAKYYRKSFLITLDGFDEAYEGFRRISLINYDQNEMKNRAEFEIDWLRALLHFVLDVKQFNHLTPRVFGSMEFCIAVPDNRFYEVFRMERDSYRYIDRYRSLDWSGIELAILLRKRLEELCKTSTDKQKRPSDRLTSILRQRYPHIPIDITFSYNGREYTMPLFFYVLRHTFWRPREILMYYSRIIAAAESLRRRRQTISVEVIRRLIQEMTREVILSEFFSEFQYTFINIADIIAHFAKKDLFLPYDDVARIVNPIDFRSVSGSLEPKDVDEKIQLLYRIGFLGVLVTQELQDRFNIRNKHAFYFNEGLFVMRGVGERMFDGYTFIIHPIFTEFLHLNTSNNEFVLELTWEYLYEMEEILSGSGFARF